MTTTHTTTAAGVADRIAALDWPSLLERLDDQGFVQTPSILTAAERHGLRESFDGGRFRATIDMRATASATARTATSTRRCPT